MSLLPFGRLSGETYLQESTRPKVKRQSPFPLTGSSVQEFGWDAIWKSTVAKPHSTKTFLPS